MPSVTPLALLMIEVDALSATDGVKEPLKAIHHVLRQVATQLRRFLPRDWMLARYGGERFVLVLPECTSKKARPAAESLSQRVASSLLTVGLSELHATVCIGGVERGGHDRAAADLLARASHALDVAKSRGPNQIEFQAVD